MRNMKYKIIALVKDFLLYSRLLLLFGWAQHMLRFAANLIGLSKWVQRHSARIAYNDFYLGKRDYNRREQLFEYLAVKEHLADTAIQYLEFGVMSGNSFNWWLDRNSHPDSRFWGFDTFEGLPEKWLFFKPGAMAASMPAVQDQRAGFIKGLFQHTLLPFLKANLNTAAGAAPRKVIHMDADLFSSTVFVLTAMAPYLQPGDMILFDEFNVPNHEYAAWELFTSTYYIAYEVLGAVNNFYQVAVKYKGVKAEQ